MNSLFRKPTFWICFALISALCSIYTYNFFSRAFPIVNLTITMDRDQALEQSHHLAERFRWGPSEPSAAVSFDTDSEAQTFIELEGGGQDAYVRMLQQHWYEPYQWHVRLLREFETNETHVYFTPDGKPYGFKEIIAEDTDLPSLKKSEARELVEQELTHSWHIKLDNYELIEASKKAQQNNRVDRTFVYERTDITLNDGRYRLKVVISGNKLTELKHFIKIPEAFTHTYKEMRSYNEAIASAGWIFSYIFYVLIGCLLGLFLLLRINWITWRAPIAWALLIASLEFVSTLNSLPLWWMHYKTESSMQGFLLQLIVQALSQFFMLFTIMALVFATAEGLTRRAFGNHVQLWKSWSSDIANSYTILGQTIGGYLMVAIDLAFLVTFYLLTTTYFGWWTPLSHLVNPNVLANYMPWFSSIATSLRAGFLEECQYRAIPLAGAALLGTRFGKKRWWLTAAFILQAIVFSAAHASYPAQPAYARLVELIIPSFIFAGIYIRFGLLPSIISHYTYDVILFALPIFLAQNMQGWLNKLAVIICIFIPLWIVFYRRLSQGTWVSLSSDILNRMWQPIAPSTTNLIKHPITTVTLNLFKQNILIIISCICCAISLIFTPFTADSPPLHLSSQEATTIAQKTLHDNGISLDEAYKPYVQIKGSFKDSHKNALQHIYAWQNYNTFKFSTYDTLLGTYLKPPRWLVRFLRFDGSLTQRSQEYAVSVGAANPSMQLFNTNPTYQRLNWHHKIPEQLPGAQLTKKEARQIAHQTLTKEGYDLSTLYEVKAKPKQLLNRTDWSFTFANKEKMGYDERIKQGELQVVISIAEDQVNQVTKKVKVPEQYKRNWLNNKTVTSALQTICQLLIWALFIAGMLIALLYWARGALPTHLFVIGFTGLFLLYTLNLLNSWPQLIAQFNTQAPFINQVFTTYGLLIMRCLMRTTICAFMFSLVVATRPYYSYKRLSSHLISGISVGLILGCLWWACTELFKPSIEPTWGYYDHLGTALPALGFALHYIMQFILYTLSFSLCTIAINYITNSGKHRIGIAAIGAIIISLVATSLQTLETVPYWIISSIILGLILTAVWYLIVRFSYASIPIALAVCFSLSVTQQMTFDLVPYSLPTGLLTIAILILLSYSWLLLCRKYQHAEN